MFSGPIEDRLALRELIDRYSDAVIHKDAMAWGATWSDDATWRFRGGEIEGREAIVATWTRAMAGFDSVWFSAFPGRIEISGDTAVMLTHTFEYLMPAGGPPRLQSGLYNDRAIRTADGWRFAERSFASREMKL
ncbi:nuclear transport factor 2 family protein [Polymorphobacter sp.]|uniref:nuclear transport factor 2 family protein n=1 Tax=Polymorphobacter sp. TaxID=1909290 RepID=UPI003F71B4BC